MSYDYPKEIPNTRHVPQPSGYDDLFGAGQIPNTIDAPHSSTKIGSGRFRVIDSVGGGESREKELKQKPIPNTTDPILAMIAAANSDQTSSLDGNGNGNGDGGLSGEERYLKELARMQGLNTNYSHSNKWIGYFPLMNVLGKKYNNLELNLTRFSIPQLVMGSTTTTFKGYSYEFPTKVIDAESKQIDLEYIIDEKWANYKALFKWCSATEGQINQVIDTSDVQTIAMSDLIDVRIWLLDSFKNRIIDFVFENAWIKTFQNLSLAADNPDEVHHTITLAYSNFYIENTQVG